MTRTLVATSLLALLLGCKARSSGSVKDDEGDPDAAPAAGEGDQATDEGAPAGGGTWGPEIVVRDTHRPPRKSNVKGTGPINPADIKEGGQIVPPVVTEHVNAQGVVEGETVSVKAAVINNKAASPAERIVPFEQTFEFKQPDNGWYVTPIQVTLLAESGDVLMTGWGRRDKEVCNENNDTSAITMGARRYGATFRLDPKKLPQSAAKVAPPFSVQDNEIAWQINHIAEGIVPNNLWEHGVFYCSGQTTLADGRVIYTGGSQYNQLNFGQRPLVIEGKEVRNMPLEEQEWGLGYAKVFNPKTNVFEVVSSAAGQYGAAGGPREAGKEWNTMWYPTNTRLPNGKIVTNSGFYRYAREIDETELRQALGRLRAKTDPAAKAELARLEQDNPNLKNVPSMGPDEFFDASNRSIQLFDPAAWDCALKNGSCPPIWSVLSRHDETPAEIKPGLRDFVHSFLLYKPVDTDGRRFQMAMAGFSGQWFLFDASDGNTAAARRFLKDPKGKRSYPPALPLHPDRTRRAEGPDRSSTALLLPTGEIMTMGGSDHPAVGQRVDIYNPYPNCENYRDMGVNAPCQTWRHLNTTTVRDSPASVLLPDGSVWLGGGWRDIFRPENKAKGFSSHEENDPTYTGQDAPRGRMTPQIIQPVTLTGDGRIAALPTQPEAQRYADAAKFPGVTDMAPPFPATPKVRDQEWERGYHHWEILLKDGSILVGGGTNQFQAIGCERPSIQVFRPPYMDSATRPQWAGKASRLDMRVGGQAVSVQVNLLKQGLRASKGRDQTFGYSGVVLLAPGSFTHGFNQNQRYVGLSYNLSGNTLTIDPPRDAQIAPPGPYLMFLVNKAGVPSEGMYVNLQ